MIRAIFFDIDGTLLDSATGKVPPSTLACLRALQRKGVRLWVATGRFPAMTTFLRDIFPFDGVITLNGQLATDKDGQVLHRMAHEPENIRALVGRLHRAGGAPYVRLMGGLPPERHSNDAYLRRLAGRLPEM